MENLTMYQIVMALGLSGSLLMILKFIPSKILIALFVKCSTRFYVTNSTESEFLGVLKWLQNHNISKHIKSYYFSGNRLDIDIAPGEYWFMLDWKTICTLNRKSNIRENYDAPLETLSITLIGKNQSRYYKELRNYIDIELGKNMLTVMKTNSAYTSTKHPKRSFDGIFVNNNIIIDIKNKLDKWRLNKNVYKEKGLVDKIGFLFYGPPGTGKTSLAKAIASYLNLSIISIQCGQNSEYVLNAITKNRVILFDDIDVLIEASKKENAPLSYDRLLSFLDGIDSPTNSVFIFTTNNKDLLPEALIRYGRIDYQYYLGPINNEVAYSMCAYFGLTTKEASNIINENTNEHLPAELQCKILEVLNTDSKILK